MWEAQDANGDVYRYSERNKGRRFIGIEREAEYVAIAEARIKAAL